MPEIAVDSIVAKAGTKAHGYVTAVNRVDGSALGLPVVIVAGRKDGPALLVDGAIHGDEPEGTLAIMSFARELDPEQLAGAFIGVPTGWGVSRMIGQPGPIARASSSLFASPPPTKIVSAR